MTNLFGYYQLTQFLTTLCVYSTFIALAAFTALRVFTLLLLAAIEAPSAERLAVVRLHRAAIARWVPRVLQWAGALVWLGATLDLMNVRTWVNQQIVALFNFNIVGGSGNITLGEKSYAVLLVENTNDGIFTVPAKADRTRRPVELLIDLDGDGLFKGDKET